MLKDAVCEPRGDADSEHGKVEPVEVSRLAVRVVLITWGNQHTVVSIAATVPINVITSASLPSNRPIRTRAHSATSMSPDRDLCRRQCPPNHHRPSVRSGGAVYPRMKLLFVFAVRMAHIDEAGLSKRIERFHHLRR